MKIKEFNDFCKNKSVTLQGVVQNVKEVTTTISQQTVCFFDLYDDGETVHFVAFPRAYMNGLQEIVKNGITLRVVGEMRRGQRDDVVFANSAKIVLSSEQGE